MVTSSLSEHLEKLHYFVGIAEAGSLAKAADRLRISQPTLSHNIKVLERVLGLKLLLRTSRGIQLTEPGVRLYQHGKKLLQETALLERELRLHDSSEVREIELGTKEPLALYLWPGYLKEIESKYPHLEVSLHISRLNSELLNLLRQEKLDMLMIPDPPEAEDIISFELFRDTFGIYQSPKTKRESKRLFIFRNALCGNHQTIDSVLKREHLFSEEIRDVDSFNVAKAMALNGLGSALLPTSHVGPEIRAGKLVEATSPLMPADVFGELRICLCWLEKNSRKKKLREVLRAIKGTASNC